MAREAGAYLRTEQSKLRDSQIERKHSHDYVSYVDKTCEEQIVAQLRQLLPEAAFLTEEGTTEIHPLTQPSLSGRSFDDTPSLGGDGGGVTWVIDPLDGTTNYIHGFNPFAVSIALRNEREILLGVVYEVTLDECFYAWQGGGAWLNGQPIHVSTKPIEEALLGIELPYDADMYSELGRRLIGHFYGLCGGIRMNGSAAVALCNVACGRWDGWLERGIQPWDFMAAALLVQEAGGTVTTYGGDAFFLDGHEVVVSNGLIQKDLLAAL